MGEVFDLTVVSDAEDETIVSTETPLGSSGKKKRKSLGVAAEVVGAEAEGSEGDCSICRESLINGTGLGCHPNHVFCRECIQQWVGSSIKRRTCPECRAPATFLLCIATGERTAIQNNDLLIVEEDDEDEGEELWYQSRLPVFLHDTEEEEEEEEEEEASQVRLFFRRMRRERIDRDAEFALFSATRAGQVDTHGPFHEFPADDSAGFAQRQLLEEVSEHVPVYGARRAPKLNAGCFDSPSSRRERAKMAQLRVDAARAEATLRRRIAGAAPSSNVGSGPVFQPGGQERARAHAHVGVMGAVRGRSAATAIRADSTGAGPEAMVPGEGAAGERSSLSQLVTQRSSLSQLVTQELRSRQDDAPNRSEQRKRRKMREKAQLKSKGKESGLGVTANRLILTMPSEGLSCTFRRRRHPAGARTGALESVIHKGSAALSSSSSSSSSASLGLREEAPKPTKLRSTSTSGAPTNKRPATRTVLSSLEEWGQSKCSFSTDDGDSCSQGTLLDEEALQL
jgi:hypothetical protein